MTEGRARQLGCEKCRVRHAKCEGGIPCKRCVRLSLDCQPGARDPFRVANLVDESLGFDANQIWCRTSSKALEFIDQTLETSRHYEKENWTPEGRGASPASDQSNVAQGRCDAFVPLDITSTDHDPFRSFPVPDGHQDAHGLLSPEDDVVIPRPLDYQTSPSLAILPRKVGDAPHNQHIHGADLNELRGTLAYFINSVGPSLDPGDQYSTLARRIAERATTDPQLLLEIKSLPRKRETRIPPQPVTSPRSDVFVFGAANVLLSAYLTRLRDNLWGSGMTSSTEEAETIRAALNNPAMFSCEDIDLAHQVLWASLRHELFMAITNQDASYVDGIDETMLLSLKPSFEDAEWVSQILFQLVRAVKYCLGDSNSSVVFDQLVNDLDAWANSRPELLAPVFFQGPQIDGMLPEVMFLNDPAAVAAQYYHIVRIILLIHNPRMPRVGVAKKKATRHMNEQVKNDVKFVCAVAESRGPLHPMQLNACMAIALGGDVFHDPEGLALLQDILVKSERQYGWPTVTVQDGLRHCAEE